MRKVGGTAGFTLIEVLVAMTLLALALALAAQLLAEGAQRLSDVAAEQRDQAVPLALSRLRADVQAATALSLEGGLAGRVLLTGLPEGRILYERSGDELVRSPLSATGAPIARVVLIQGLTAWSCELRGPRLLRLDLRYLGSARRRSPLALPPSWRGPRVEERSESLFLALRGAGLGDSW
jgi:prepilin-type N-terminal cleavage/methylation domain-containing protein